MGYTYYPGGLRKELKLDGTVYIGYLYDDAGRLQSLSRGTSAFGFSYDEDSRRTSRTNPNGVTVDYSYDELSRLLGLGNTAIGVANYTYDDAGNRLSKTGSLSPAEGYGYDKLDRLTTVSRGATLSEAYDYDKVGNLTLNQKGTLLLQGTYSERNQLLSESAGGSLRYRGHLDEGGRVTVNGQAARMVSDTVFEADVPIASGTNDVAVEARDWSGNTRTNTYRMEIGAGTPATFSYDANGNMVEKVEGATTWTYMWNAENQLVRVCKDVSPCNDASALARFAYDPLGRRVEKVAAGVTYSYLYDGQDILRETITNGATTTVYKYVHGPGVDEPLAREDAAGALSYYYADGLGSIVKMTDAAGTVIQTRQYDAFGNLEVGASEPGYSYTGREWDPETGLYYYRARYYDPKAGRFISEDPIGFQGGMNFYAYVGNNPANAVDPEGLAAQIALDPETQRKWFGPPPGPNASAQEKALYKLNANITLITGLWPVGIATAPATAGSRLVGHHVLPQAFRRFFERAGINIDRYLVKIPQEWHQRWVHAAGARGGRWNAAWRAFFETNPEATADEIWDFLAKVLDEVGLCGS